MTEDKRGGWLPTGDAVLWAVVAPPIIAVLFSAAFRSIQSRFDPQGVLEGVDLTPYARRNETLFMAFALILLTFVIVGAIRVARGRLVFIAIASLVSIVSYFGAFFGMMAP